MKSACFVVAAALPAFFTVSAVFGQIAPAPTFGQNPANTNVSPYTGVVANPFVRWQIQHERGMIGNPAIILDARGVLYAQSLTPVFASTGQPAGVDIPSWRDSTPSIDGSGNIYQWYQGQMRAFAASGAPLWTGPTTATSDGNSVRVAPNGSVIADGDGHLTAFTPQGQVQWSVPGSSRTPAAIDGAGNIYTSGGQVGGPFRSYDSNGNLRWSAPLWAPGWDSPAILGPDGNLYVSADFGTSVRVLNTVTGATVRQQTNLFGGIQAISADGTLYSCSYQTVRATDLFGNTRWETHVPSNVFLEDLVVDASGHVYCTSEQNQLYAYTATGQLMWSLQLPNAGSQTLAPVIGDDGTLYVQNGGLLMAIAPTPGAAAIGVAVGLFGLRRRR